MKYSYWELKTWFSDIDFVIVGSGIVGLNCALRLRENFPEKRILILEKGLLPQGASTKNAGFACFGSLSEIIDDLNQSTESQVLELIIKRTEGLNYLRSLLGDTAIDYKRFGGYELFLKNDALEYQKCLDKLSNINKLLQGYFNDSVFRTVNNKFGFKDICDNLIYNPYEGQIDTGKMMDALLQKAINSGIKILNNISVNSFHDSGSHVEIICDDITLRANKLFIATNGFASELGIEDVHPARAQVLITKPIDNLVVEGTFHIKKGYYYFRNIDNRLLFGGGRELDIPGETTTEFGLTDRIQNQLEHLLETVILPNTTYEIDHRWSGIMGVGETKKPVIKFISDNVFCGVKLGGMGIAIGSLIGKELAEFV